MEELVEYVKASVQVVEGVEMVPLEIALTALNTANATLALEGLHETIAELYQTLSQTQDLDEQEI